MRDFLVASSLLSVIIGTTLTERAVATDYDQVIVRAFQGQSDIERRVVDLLADRLRERGCPNVIADSTARNEHSLLISLGVAPRHAELQRICRDAGVTSPTEHDPGPEGFLLTDVPDAGFRHVIAAAVDDRGALYAAGALLRTVVVRDGHVSLPDRLAIHTAPAFEMRGTHVSQGHTMRELTGSRAWTQQEWRHELLDYALAGANTFEMSGSSGEAERRRIAREVAFYEDAGEGGFYDDAGNPDRSPHMARGWPYGDGRFSMANRPSQRTAAFTTVESPGVTFEYRRLDPEASYRVRLALVRPVFKARFAMHQRQQSESIFADGYCLAKDLTLPEFECQFFEYPIPREATADGALKLWFEKSSSVGEGPAPEVTVWRNTGGWGTLVSEVWLMKQ